MNLPIFAGKVGLQQRVFPFYRVPFIDLLAKQCTGGLGFFAGDPRPGESIESGSSLQVARFTHADNQHRGKGLFFTLHQTNLMDWLARLDPDVLIAEANARYQSTLQAIRWMHERTRSVIGWGLGSPQTGGMLEFIRDWQRARYLRQFDGLVAYSKKGAAEYVKRGMDPARVFIAPNAATMAPTYPPPTRTTPDRISILFVGRLQARKRLDLLLRVCASLPEDIAPELTIVGDGPERTSLEALARDAYPRTVFTGLLVGEALTAEFLRANLFVLPGTGGLAVQQAMSYALPVMVAEGDGTQSSLVTPANGWQLEPGSKESLRSVLFEALHDPARLINMGLESYRIVKEEINVERMVTGFIEALNQVKCK